jgi:uncharacterized protein
MVKTRQEIEVIINKYRDALEALGIRPEKIILYGSYAKGTAREDSDIDLIIVSPDFSGKDLRERLEILGIAAARIMEPIQAQGFTHQEIDPEKRSSFIEEVLEYGEAA